MTPYHQAPGPELFRSWEWREEIARRAYERWVRRGCPPNTQFEDWVEAEHETLRIHEAAARFAAQAADESRGLLQAVIDNSTAVIYAKTTQGHYLFINRWFESLFKVSRQAVVGKSDFDLFPREMAEAFWRNDRRVAVSGQPMEFEEIAPHDDGPHTYISVKFPISNASDEIYAVCGISTDITERERVRARLLTEHAITGILADSLSLNEAASPLLEVIGRCLEWQTAFLWRVDPQTNVLTCIDSWQEPDVDAAEFIRFTRSLNVGRDDGLPGRVWDDGRPVWVSNVVAELDGSRARLAHETGLYRAVGFPITGNADTLGVLEFFGRDLQEPDLDVLDMMDSIGRHIGQFIERRETEDRLRRREQEAELARRIQQSCLSSAAPQLPGFDIAASALPAWETAGDYFDFLRMGNDGLGIAIGDAMGHGLGPALLMADVRAFLEALVLDRQDPGDMLTLVNRHIVNEDVTNENFVTLLLVRLDLRTRSLTYSNAGHVSGYVLDRHGTVKTVLRSMGFPLGLLPEAEFPNGSDTSLDSDEILFLSTDGVVETRSPARELFGMQRALELVRAHRLRTADEILAELLQAVEVFGHRRTDDVTAVIVKG